MKAFALLVLLLISALVLKADVRLPKIFGNNMVLQREQPIPVWGWADPKEKITITLNKQVKKVTASKDGKWRVDLSPEMAGGPFEMSVKGKNNISFTDVMIGEVWICSGQSNMEMPIAAWGYINNYQQEIQNANYPEIRQVIIPKKISSQPQDDVSEADWKHCNPDNAGQFSAAAYFFGRELYSKLHVPIGLINTTWGGTQVESWTSREAFENSDEFKDMIAEMKNVDLDELARQKEAVMKEHIEKLQGAVPVPAEQTRAWKEKDFNDAAWHSLTVPGLWEQQEPGDLDGWVWLRKTIDISAQDAGKKAVLELSAIDDNDETYLNGEKVGTTAGYNIKRKYIIPEGLLKAGKNVIAVKVEDTGGGGGIWGDAGDVKLTIDGKMISLTGKWLYRIEKVTGGAGAIGPNSYPTILYNAMISPLIPYAVKGAIWYQGEANVGRAWQYRKAFPLMITDWRNKWKQGDFPFYFVQLATFNEANGTSNKGSTWAELREAQAMTLSLPNTGMAVTTDIGNPVDIHPKNKQDVGKRLAALALNKTYGQNTVFSGPVYESYRIDGNKIFLHFTQTGTGMLVKDKYGYIKGFEVAGADHRFYYAKAFVDGDNVVVYADEVAHPAAARYNWADDAGDGNLFNKEGFPAPPFRTDDWKAITEGVKFKIN